MALKFEKTSLFYTSIFFSAELGVSSSPFKVTGKISFFSLRYASCYKSGNPPNALASLCLCGLKIIFLTTETQRTQSKELKEEFVVKQLLSTLKGLELGVRS
ncbi:hypothetical protein A6V25_03540 [Nostoc sp. ATCC 53789]|nr:hypothetical protein A6V25_03540 [Nostoc sp. ATCC 53789]